MGSGAYLSTSCLPPYPALLTPRRGVTLGVLVAWSINYVDNASYPLPLRGMGYKDARKGVLS